MQLLTRARHFFFPCHMRVALFLLRRSAEQSSSEIVCAARAGGAIVPIALLSQEQN